MLTSPPVRIAQSVLYRKEIPIRHALGILVQEGTFVYPDTPLMTVPVSQPLVTIPVAKIIGARPRDLSAFLLKATGDAVREGEVIARKKGLPFSPLRECKAPITGEVEFINYEIGEIMLSQPSGSTAVPSKAFGVVVSIEPGDRLIVELSAVVTDCIWGRGTGAIGKICVLAGKYDGELVREQLSADLAGSLLVGGTFNRDDVLYLAQRLGVSGIVVGGTPANGHEAWLESGAKVPLSAAITDGFGVSSMNPTIFESLKTYEGYEAWLNPLPNGRAEIVVNDESAPVWIGEQKPKIEMGSTVRIVRKPYFAQTAKILSEPNPKRVGGTANGNVLVRLADGSQVEIPRNNVETLVL